MTDESHTEINEWLSDFVFEDGELTSLLQGLNQNAVKQFIEYLFAEKLFLTITQNKKTGDFDIDAHIGPIGFKIKKSEMDEEKDWSDRETMHYGRSEIEFNGDM